MTIARSSIVSALGALALLSPGPARADFVGYLCAASPPPGVVLEPITDKNGACAGFRIRDAARSAPLGSGALLASTDARTVVFVQTYPLAHLDDKGRVRTLDGKALDGVVIFRDGREVARIGIDALLPSTRGVSETVSHVLWIDTFEPVVGATWKLQTKAGNTIVFDAVTGVISVSE
jgi:hypothetical protein